MDDDSRIALNVDATLYRASAFSYNPYQGPSRPVPMEIRNLEQRPRVFRGACHRCQEEGCRTFICNSRYNNGARRQDYKICEVDNDLGKV